MQEMFEASVDGEAYDEERFGQYFRPAGMAARTGDPNVATSSGTATRQATPAPEATPAPAPVAETAPVAEPTPEPTPEPLNIVDTALATSDLTSLVAALQAADGDLVNVLSGGEFTVLAPTNAAFDAFLTANGFADLSEVPTDVLANILLNHVIAGTVMSTDLAAAGAGYTQTNATNADGDAISLYFNTTNGVVFNGVSTVSQADVEGCD